MTSQQPSSSFAGVRQQHHKMSVAFLTALLDEHDETNDSDDKSSASDNGLRHISVTSSASMATASHVEHRIDLWNARSILPPTSLGTPQYCGLFNDISLPWIHYQHNRRAYPYTTVKPRARDSRPARPSYSEEQKFLIMYYRVIKKLPWCEIEDKFTTFFNLRTKKGIVSVYYRIRKNWKMKDVLDLKTGDAELDRRIVEEKASFIPHEFLARLGYFKDLNTPRDMDWLPHTGAAGSPVRSIVGGHSPIQLGPILARSASSARA